MLINSLNLLTIRSSDIDRAVQFYATLGLRFVKHSHGKGPEHYCSEDAGIAFEIYPLGPNKLPTIDTRLGFSVVSVDLAMAKLADIGVTLIAGPTDSPWVDGQWSRTLTDIASN
jgi:catechol 2,3-dioxygenase-like lactoylglutathione lyase family enzyme